MCIRDRRSSGSYELYDQGGWYHGSSRPNWDVFHLLDDYRKVEPEEKVMAYFKEINPKRSIVNTENTILEYWNEKDIPDKSVSIRTGSPQFVFYEGPPTANGLPGIHHVLSRTLKDAVCRLSLIHIW